MGMRPFDTIRLFWRYVWFESAIFDEAVRALPGLEFDAGHRLEVPAQ